MDRHIHIGARALAALALLLTAVPSGRACAADGWHPFEYETKHYEVETDVSAEFARLVGAHMEEIHAEYARRFEDYGRVRDRYKVAVYRSEGGYRDAVPSRVWGSTGVFMPSEELLAAHMGERTVEEVLRTLYHEGFHQFMFCAVSRECPVWLNEGLAEYFSEATWDGHGFVTGLVPTIRLHVVQQAVSQGAYVPFRELFALSPDKWLQNVQTDGRRANLYYCQAWSIVQFLVHAEGGRHAGMLNTFLREISEGTDQDEALRESFGTDVVGFERAWASYVMSLKPSAKFRCRDNMEAIMLLAAMIYEEPRRFESLKALRREVLRGRRYRWEITSPNGRKLRSDDTEQVSALFRCPLGRGEEDISYLLVHNGRTGMPTLVYDELPGIVITAYYKPSPGGATPRVVVEELVRDTVGEADLRAVWAARREQFR